MEKYIVLIAFITSFFCVFVLNGIIIALPDIGMEFGMNNLIQNWIPTIFVLTTTVLPYGTCVLVGITAGEVIFSAVYFVALKYMFKKFKANGENLVVT